MNNIDLSQMMTADMRRNFELDTLKGLAREQVATLLNTFDREQTGEIPMAERISWGAKLVQAQAVLAGGSSKMLELEAAETGEEVHVLATMVVDRAARYQKTAARIAGLRRRAILAVELATTTQEVTIALRNIEADLSGNPA